MYWKLSKEERDRLDRAGVDYDLRAAIEYNYLEEFKLTDIAYVWAVVEGENDGPAWHWIVRLQDGSAWYLTGSCDYTGWDCQSWLSASRLQNPGDLLAEFGGSKSHPDYLDLKEQVITGTKSLTWRERTKDQFE